MPGILTSALFTIFLAVSPFESLHIYEGSWIVTPTSTEIPAKSGTLVNICHQNSNAYSCEQIANGKLSARIVFTTTNDPKKFHFQADYPNGKSIGQSELTVDGYHWTYHSARTDNTGKTTYDRTENYFNYPDKMHFEFYESSDDKTWVIKSQGDEVRAPK